MVFAGGWNHFHAKHHGLCDTWGLRGENQLPETLQNPEICRILFAQGSVCFRGKLPLRIKHGARSGMFIDNYMHGVQTSGEELHVRWGNVCSPNRCSSGWGTAGQVSVLFKMYRDFSRASPSRILSCV